MKPNYINKSNKGETSMKSLEITKNKRILTLRSALKLECLGMKRRGQSAYSIVKSEFGFKGNKKSVLAQLEQIIEGIKS